MAVISVPNTELHLVTFIGLMLEGQAPTVLISQTAAPDAGSISITGLAPETPPAIVGVPAGSLSLTGQDAALAADLVISPDAAALALTGQAPLTIHPTTIDVSAGSLETQGFTPSIDIFVGDPDLLGMALVGWSPNVSQDSTPPEVFAQTELGEAHLVGRTPTRGVGLLLETYAPSIVGGSITISPTTGELTITGLLGEGIANNLAKPGTAAMTVSGLAPLLELPTPDAGSLTLTGLQPKIGVPLDVPVGGPIELSGYAPNLLPGIIYYTDDDSLILSTHLPSISIGLVWNDSSDVSSGWGDASASASDSWSDVSDVAGAWTDA